MDARPDNLVLIGMPGAGKSTVGHALAQALGWEFVDTDRLIEARAGCSLQAALEREGAEGFRLLEAAAVADLCCRGCVIATGGSVVYSAPAMAALARLGPRVYLEAPLPVLQARIGDARARGMLIAPDQSFAQLYAQRLPLYRRYADLTVDADRPPKAVAAAILAAAGDSPRPELDN